MNLNTYERQVALEEEYATSSIVASQKQITDLMKQGRGADIGQGKVLLANAFTSTLDVFKEELTKVHTGWAGKYYALLKRVDPAITIMAALREIFNACANPVPVNAQSLMRKVGKIIEAEALLAILDKVSPTYTNKTLEYLDRSGTKSVTHRYRTFLAGADSLHVDWEAWEVQERIQAARIVLRIIYESTGLFKWVQDATGQYLIQPSDSLAKYLVDIQEAAKAIIKYPPMLIKPVKWQNQFEGGYLTDWFRFRSPMCGIRTISRRERDWVIEMLGSDTSSEVRKAMNKAQETPYKVNKRVLQVLRQALAMQGGVMGLPNHKPDPTPAFPFPDEWLKSEASQEDLDQFKLWKMQMAAWYTKEATRKGKHVGLLGSMRELTRYQDEPELYFPAFIDWRGRMYFRSIINPQSSDAVKGCIEFAHGKPLGETGLYWLKVHVANCCGYDKATFDLRVKWVDDNIGLILNFVNNPLDVDPPESDTAFTLLAAGLALQDALALDNPKDYVCTIPVAMDATCSGLQHFSALMRDTVGGHYTNLIPNHTSEKSDIYKQVGKAAKDCVANYIHEDSVALRNYWQVNEITRSMAKKPVMTFVYGSTLLSNIDSLVLEMSDSGMSDIRDHESGRVVYSLNRLAAPVAKALRKAVVDTVPKAAGMMQYLRSLVSASDDRLRWITPVGVPVSNWVDSMEIKQVSIKAMGINAIFFKQPTKVYDKRAASAGISPNYIHSMDAAHLCKTLLHFDGSIMPIHDSFATYPSDVELMQKAIRETFVRLYSDYDFNNFLIYNNIDVVKHKPPVQGTLDLEVVKDSEFFFC